MCSSEKYEWVFYSFKKACFEEIVKVFIILTMIIETKMIIIRVVVIIVTIIMTVTMIMIIIILMTIMVTILVISVVQHY